MPLYENILYYTYYYACLPLIFCIYISVSLRYIISNNKAIHKDVLLCLMKGFLLILAMYYLL